MDGKTVVKKGYLDVLPSSAMDETYVPLWQKRFYVLIKSTETSQGRFVYFKEEEEFDKAQLTYRGYYMEQIEQVEISDFGQQKSCFQIRVKTGNIQNCYRAENEAEARHWCRLLRESIKIYKKHRHRGSGGGPLTPPARSLSSEEALSEYLVSIHETDASKRCSVSGDNQNYLLRIFTESIDLWTEDNRILYSWPYSTIRRLGVSSAFFTMEVGRKAPTGEGVFTFLTNQSEAILSDAQAVMKRLQGPDPITPPPLETDTHRGEGDYTSLETYLTTNVQAQGPMAQGPMAQAPRAQGPVAQGPRAQGHRAQGSVYENVTRDKTS